jgi:serine/threonine-protein kinase
MDAAGITLEPGFRLDRYELLCPIARGGMAQVWLARLHGKRGFEKLCAVKTILSKYATDLRFQQMFLDEARISSVLEHTNVTQIFDLGEHGDILFLVMEWVDGESLARLFRASERAGEHMPPAIVGRMLVDACAGLHAAHELTDKAGNLLNVVHRDVSPQNILVSVRGDVKLIDFGIAKLRDRVAGDSMGGVFKGKILYMAPEQALGKPVDRRADVWAVGAVMYHLLSGVPAFGGDNHVASLHLLTHAEAGLIPLPESVPEPLRMVIDKALVKDPDRRIPTAAELGAAIEDAMKASGLTATSRHVAAFMLEQLAERNAARKKAVALALEAADQRHREPEE